nr:F-box/RNI-like/FBD-like domains-containing protein [Tanacetum cinerariifolium]
MFPNENYKVRFCLDLFKTWDSLVELNLEEGFLLDVHEDEFLFSCLKRLQLVCVGYFKDCSVTNLVSRCPVLEDLFVERDVYPDNLEMFKVSSMSLKNLWITFNSDIDIESLFLQFERKFDYYRISHMLCAFVVQCKPEDVLLVLCLKRLQLVFVSYFKDSSVTNLVSGCPVLEDLFVEREVYPDNLEMFKVSSVSLKNLWIAFNRFVTWNFLKVVIDAPKLEYIYVLDNMSNDYSLTKPLDLVRGDLNDPHSLNRPMFPNTVKLVIDWGLDLIPVLLKNMPNLEHITFEHQHEPLIVEGNIPEEPPFCLRFQLKEITLPSKRSLTQEEFTLISHQGYPPKFVFLQNEPEPPWKPHDMRSKAMSLEDKTRFEARGRAKERTMGVLCLLMAVMLILFYRLNAWYPRNAAAGTR